MALVFMGKAGERPPVGQLQPALRPFEGLNAGLLVKTQDHRVLRLRQVKADHVGSLLRKLRIGGNAPASPPLETDAKRAQHPPDTIRADPERAGQQLPVPAGMPSRRGLVKLREQTVAKLILIERRRASRAMVIVQAAQALALEARAPLADHRRTDPQLCGDLLGSHPLGRPQDNLAALHITRLGFAFAPVRVELLALVMAQDDWGRGLGHPTPSLRYELMQVDTRAV